MHRIKLRIGLPGNITQHLFIAALACLSQPCWGQAWPQWRGENRDATIDNPRIMESLPEGEIPKLWTAPVGPGYSGPTIADGRVYLTDRQGDGPAAEERVLRGMGE